MARDHEIFAQAVASSMARVWRVDGRAHALGLLEQLDAGEGSVRVRFVPKDGRPSDPHIGREALGRVLRGGAPLHDKLEGPSPRLYSYAAVHLGDETPGRARAVRVARAARCLRALDRAARGGHRVVPRASCAPHSRLRSAAASSGRPVRALVEQARRIGAGDLGSRLDLPQHDEIAELGREMNAMSSKLSDANRRLVAETAARVHALEQLRHADRLVTVGKLASGIAHELGTPLNVVSGRAKMISQSPASDEPMRNNARIVMEQSERMAQIIRQLLGFCARRQAQQSLRRSAPLGRQHPVPAAAHRRQAARHAALRNGPAGFGRDRRRRSAATSRHQLGGERGSGHAQNPAWSRLGSARRATASGTG